MQLPEEMKYMQSFSKYQNILVNGILTLKWVSFLEEDLFWTSQYNHHSIGHVLNQCLHAWVLHNHLSHLDIAFKYLSENMNLDFQNETLWYSTQEFL